MSSTAGNCGRAEGRGKRCLFGARLMKEASFVENLGLAWLLATCGIDYLMGRELWILNVGAGVEFFKGLAIVSK
jgi:hypothetical protein